MVRILDQLTADLLELSSYEVNVSSAGSGRRFAPTAARCCARCCSRCSRSFRCRSRHVSEQSAVHAESDTT